jgi:hypothetical protein
MHLLEVQAFKPDDITYSGFVRHKCCWKLRVLLMWCLSHFVDTNSAFLATWHHFEAVENKPPTMRQQQGLQETKLVLNAKLCQIVKWLK